MFLPPVIWASSGTPPIKKKFRFQPCNLRFFRFRPYGHLTEQNANMAY